jgi:hypothetical protein
MVECLPRKSEPLSSNGSTAKIKRIYRSHMTNFHLQASFNKEIGIAWVAPSTDPFDSPHFQW